MNKALLIADICAYSIAPLSHLVIIKTFLLSPIIKRIQQPMNIFMHSLLNQHHQALTKLCRGTDASTGTKWSVRQLPLNKTQAKGSGVERWVRRSPNKSFWKKRGEPSPSLHVSILIRWSNWILPKWSSISLEIAALPDIKLRWMIDVKCFNCKCVSVCSMGQSFALQSMFWKWNFV